MVWCDDPMHQPCSWHRIPLSEAASPWHHPSIHPSISLVCPASSPTAFLFLLVCFLVLKSCVSLALSKGGYFHPASPQHPATTTHSPTGHCLHFHPRMSDICNNPYERDLANLVQWLPIPGLLNLQIMLTINNAGPPPFCDRFDFLRSAFTGGGSVNTSRD